MVVAKFAMLISCMSCSWHCYCACILHDCMFLNADMRAVLSTIKTYNRTLTVRTLYEPWSLKKKWQQNEKNLNLNLFFCFKWTEKARKNHLKFNLWISALMLDAAVRSCRRSLFENNSTTKTTSKFHHVSLSCFTLPHPSSPVTLSSLAAVSATSLPMLLSLLLVPFAHPSSPAFFNMATSRTIPASLLSTRGRAVLQSRYLRLYAERSFLSEVAHHLAWCARILGLGHHVQKPIFIL